MENSGVRIRHSAPLLFSLLNSESGLHMSSTLHDLRARIAGIDRELVAALATRSRLGPATQPSADKERDRLAARVQAAYAAQVSTFCPASSAAGNSAACAAADREVVAAVLQRLRIVLAIAKAKAAGETPRFRALVAARDAAGIEQAITQPAVEEQVVARAVAAAREQHAAGLPANFPDRVAAVYRNWIIPLARSIQVETLLAEAQKTK